MCIAHEVFSKILKMQKSRDVYDFCFNHELLSRSHFDDCDDYGASQYFSFKDGSELCFDYKNRTDLYVRNSKGKLIDSRQGVYWLKDTLSKRTIKESKEILEKIINEAKNEEVLRLNIHFSEYDEEGNRLISSVSLKKEGENFYTENRNKLSIEVFNKILHRFVAYKNENRINYYVIETEVSYLKFFEVYFENENTDQLLSYDSDCEEDFT